MKAEKFSEIINDINDKYIDEAVGYKAKEKQKGLAKTIRLWRGIAIAACSVLFCGAIVIVIAASLNGSSKNLEVESSASYSYKTASNNGYYEMAGATANEDGGTVYYADEAAAEEVEIEDTTRAEASTISIRSDKIIYTVYISMQTTDFTATASEIERLTNEVDGYFESSNSYNGNSSYRNAYYTIRIPVERLDSFLNGTDGAGTITNISKNAEDVSEYYYDTESRLNTAKTKLARLQELLAKAEDMTDIITIENEISYTEQEIDSLQGALNSYDSQVEYSTVTIDLSEVYKVEEESAPLTFGERIAGAFSNGISRFGEFLEGLAVWFAGSWIWILIIAVVVVAVVLVVKTIRKRIKKYDRARRNQDE